MRRSNLGRLAGLVWLLSGLAAGCIEEAPLPPAVTATVHPQDDAGSGFGGASEPGRTADIDAATALDAGGEAGAAGLDSSADAVEPAAEPTGPGGSLAADPGRDASATGAVAVEVGVVVVARPDAAWDGGPAAGAAGAGGSSDAGAADRGADAGEARPASDAGSDGAGAGGKPIVAMECAEVICPELFAVTGRCNGQNSVCHSESRPGDVPTTTLTNYCHSNGVKKLASTVVNADGSYVTTMRVFEPGGKACYELGMATTPGSAVERWVYRSSAGSVLATGAWDSKSGKTFLTCGGVTYDVSATDCPGTDGEPGPDECKKAACSSTTP